MRKMILCKDDIGISVLHDKKEVPQYFRYTFQTLQQAQKLAVIIADQTNNPNENLVICELLNNAIEHGNLGISYEEKSDLIERDLFLEEIEKRIILPENIHKYAEVDIVKYTSEMVVTITDMGKGFNYKQYLTIDESRIFESHGRGIAIANSILKIKYFDIGNKVSVFFRI